MTDGCTRSRRLCVFCSIDRSGGSVFVDVIPLEIYMATNKLLLEVARGLRYQHLPELVGSEITIDSLSSIFVTLADTTQQRCSLVMDDPSDVAELNRALAGPIGKYGLIDFEYPCHTKIESAKTDNVRLLREFGFLPKSDAESDKLFLIDDDPECCIREIQGGISQNQTWLKLFFNTTSPEFHKLDFKTRFKQAASPELIEFPLDFRCTDACLTNAPFIWFNRHFYM